MLILSRKLLIARPAAGTGVINYPGNFSLPDGYPINYPVGYPSNEFLLIEFCSGPVSE